MLRPSLVFTAPAPVALALLAALLVPGCKSSDDDDGAGGTPGSGSDGNVSFSQSQGSVPEGAGAFGFELQLSQTSGSDVRVTLQASGGATDGEDYFLTTATVDIPAGQISASGSLAVLEDELFELDETAILTIDGVESAADVIAGAVSSITITLLDNDVAPTIEFVTTAVSANEADTEIRLPVSLSAPAGIDVVVPLSYGGSAGAADYSMPPAALTIPAGQESADVVLVPIVDGIEEGPEEILVTLEMPDVGFLGAAVEASVTLLDGEFGEPWGPFVIEARDLGLNQNGLYTAQLSEGSASPISTPDLGLFDGALALNPAGDRVAYRAFNAAASSTAVYVSSAAGSAPLPITGTLTAGLGTWSPDGEYLAVWNSPPGILARTLYTVRRDGTELSLVQPVGQELPDSESSETARWSVDASQVLFRSQLDPNQPIALFRANRDGSALEPVSASLGASIDIDETYAWSPTGTAIAFSSGDDLYVQEAPGADLIQISSDLAPSGDQGYNFQWNPDGSRLAYAAFDQADEDPRIFTWDPSGAMVQLTLVGLVLSEWSWAPGGDRMAYVMRFGLTGSDLLHTVLPDGSQNQQVSGQTSVRDFLWSPDGAHLAFRVGSNGEQRLFTTGADGSGFQSISLMDDGFDAVLEGDDYRWAPDSSRVSYVAMRTTVQTNGMVLASNAVDGGDLLVHKGPLIQRSETLGDHRWTQDSAFVAAIVIDTPPTTSSVRYWPRTGALPEVNATANAANGNASILSLWTR